MAVASFPTLVEVEAMLKDLGLALSINGQSLRLTKDGSVLSSVTLPSGGSDIDLGAVNEDILPSSSGAYDVGSSSKKFNNVYANNVYINGNKGISAEGVSISSGYSNSSGYIVLNFGGTRNLLICFGTTLSRASVDANYAVTFPKSFYGIPKVVMQMFKVSVGSNSTENAQYRNGQEISGFFGTNQPTNVTSSTGRVNGFKFIPGNGSSYYYSYIAMGYEY